MSSSAKKFFAGVVKAFEQIWNFTHFQSSLILGTLLTEELWEFSPDTSLHL